MRITKTGLRRSRRRCPKWKRPPLKNICPMNTRCRIKLQHSSIFRRCSPGRCPKWKPLFQENIYRQRNRCRPKPLQPSICPQRRTYNHPHPSLLPIPRTYRQHSRCTPKPDFQSICQWDSWYTPKLQSLRTCPWCMPNTPKFLPVSTFRQHTEDMSLKSKQLFPKNMCRQDSLNTLSVQKRIDICPPCKRGTQFDQSNIEHIQWNSWYTTDLRFSRKCPRDSWYTPKLWSLRTCLRHTWDSLKLRPLSTCPARSPHRYRR